MKLGIYILAIRYLEEGAFCFTKVIGNNKKINEEIKTVSNSEKEVKIKQVFYKKKRDIWALFFAAVYLFALLFVSIPRLLALFASTIFVSKSFTFLSALLSTFPVSELFAPPFLSTMPIPELSAFFSLSAMLMPKLSVILSLFAVLVFRLSASLSLFAMPIPGLSALLVLFKVLVPKLFALLYLSTMIMLGSSIFCLYLLCLRHTLHFFLHSLFCRYQCLF